MYIVYYKKQIVKKIMGVVWTRKFLVVKRTDLYPKV